MEKFEVNLENLSEEEIESFLALVRKSNQPNPKKRWRAKMNEEYWYLDSCFNSCYDFEEGEIEDDVLYKCGNYFKTEEETDFVREQRLVYQELKDYALEHNEEKIYWNEKAQNKYFIWYGHFSNKLVIESTIVAQGIGQIYFSSKEIAQNAIKTVGENRIKKYLFGVESYE